ncbi:hypothetical protein [Kribbella sp. CA-293567]|uniref:hypothetical protein n=1 Tax=Kribbella sp. CA-293567 TaxID=3002436 RepID=UPI0022DD1905|nr:hypothetical protein [Kribbella sp. CA-293567]WBQ04352.1 hypothetical protein OX958_30850 [Kribbella sp. CA-293567]
MDDSNDTDAVRRRVTELAARAEAIVERLEATAVDSRWAMTAFSRYRVCELLGIIPYLRYDGDLEGDPAVLYDEAAEALNDLDVAIEDVSWRLALADSLRSAATDVRRVQSARDL